MLYTWKLLPEFHEVHEKQFFPKVQFRLKASPLYYQEVFLSTNLENKHPDQFQDCTLLCKNQIRPREGCSCGHCAKWLRTEDRYLSGI